MTLDAVTIVSILALLVSVVSVVLSARTSRRQHQLHNRQAGLQERLVDLETARERDRLRATKTALVVASIERVIENCTKTHVRAPRTDYFLKIENSGRAAARNIAVQLDGKPALEHSLIPRSEDEVTSLGPGAGSRYFLALTMGSPRVLDVVITWEDDSGQPGRWESQVKL